MTPPPVSRLKILTVVAELSVGGTERAAQNFATAYGLLGHESRVWAVDRGGPRYAQLKVAGIEVSVGIGELTRLAEWKPDLIHLHTHGLRDIEIRALIDQTEICVVEQNVFSDVSPWIDLVDVSFQLSESCLRRYLSRRAKQARAPAAVVPNPVEVERFARNAELGQDFRERHLIPCEAVVIGRVGQPITYKWSPLLISTFEKLADRVPSLWLLLVGAPREVHSQAGASKHSARIVLIDRLEGDAELVAAYSAMDVFGHAAAQGESFGYVLTEAMLCEVPVVTLSTPWGDNAQVEVVGHGVGGLVAANSRAFRQLMDRLVMDPDLRAALGAQGRSKVHRQYAAVPVAERAVTLATEVMKGVLPPRSPQQSAEVFAVEGVPPLLSRWFEATRLGEYMLPKISCGAYKWLIPHARAKLSARQHPG